QVPEVTIRQNPGHAEAMGPETWAVQENGQWRALTWRDLQRLAPQVPGQQMTGPDLPAGWPPAPDPVAAKHAQGQADRLPAVKTGTLQRLDDLVQSGRVKRQLRKLAVPDTVYVLSRGATTRNQMDLQRQGDNEYAGTFTELKESVKFQVRGEDYYTL